MRKMSLSASTTRKISPTQFLLAQTALARKHATMTNMAYLLHDRCGLLLVLI
jgi:hypothetical protein